MRRRCKSNLRLSPYSGWQHGKCATHEETMTYSHHEFTQLRHWKGFRGRISTVQRAPKCTPYFISVVPFSNSNKLRIRPEDVPASRYPLTEANSRYMYIVRALIFSAHIKRNSLSTSVTITYDSHYKRLSTDFH